MMTQTFALLLDAYRELRAKKMFWIVMILSVVVIASFSIVGVEDGQITVLWFKPLRTPGRLPAMYLYKTLFSNVIVGLWFTWIATLLALVSTAGIFPDFLASGSVDLFLSRPISRVRLFFTKYLAGLLFVTLQVSVFTVLSFFVLGVRGHLWQPGLFIAIPLVVLFFSYLFGICALFGVWTRSTMAALMLTLLAWVVIWGAGVSTRTFQSNDANLAMQNAALDDQIDAAKAAIAQAQTQPAAAVPQAGPSAAPAADSPATGSAGVTDIQLAQMQHQLADLQDQRKQNEVSSSYTIAEELNNAIEAIAPKTTETINLLDRLLFSDQDLRDAAQSQAQAVENRPNFRPAARGPFQRQAEVRLELQEKERERPAWWIIGTSLLFEAVMLTLAVWIFCTRDF